MKFTDTQYNFLKQVALLWLPALATLWITLSKIWGFPYGAEIGATITALDTFLGACLGISSANYYREKEE